MVSRANRQARVARRAATRCRQPITSPAGAAASPATPAPAAVVATRAGKALITLVVPTPQNRVKFVELPSADFDCHFDRVEPSPALCVYCMCTQRRGREEMFSRARAWPDAARGGGARRGRAEHGWVSGIAARFSHAAGHHAHTRALQQTLLAAGATTRRSASRGCPTAISAVPDSAERRHTRARARGGRLSRACWGGRRVEAAYRGKRWGRSVMRTSPLPPARDALRDRRQGAIRMR